MATVTIYTTPICPFCLSAKSLLKRKGVAFEEVDVSRNPTLREEMTRMAGSHTVPQVFVDERHIGDCSEIHALDKEGRLDALIQGEA